MGYFLIGYTVGLLSMVFIQEILIRYVSKKKEFPINMIDPDSTHIEVNSRLNNNTLFPTQQILNNIDRTIHSTLELMRYVEDLKKRQNDLDRRIKDEEKLN